MKGKTQVQLDSMVWNKESHGLFDYESKECKEYKFCLVPPFKIFRLGDNILIGESNQTKGPDSVLLGEFIQLEDGTIKFKPVKQNDKDQDAYLKLNNNQQNGSKYKLAKNDLIKLGRIEYFVSEIQKADCITQVADDVFNLDKHIQLSDQQQFFCKFCLVEGPQDLNDPYLCKLCNCQGNIEYVHYSCLQTWINLRIEKKATENTVIYAWKKAMECEICKEPLPKRIFINGQQKPFELIQIERIPFPYIVLEQITRETGQSKSLVLVHSVNNESILIGRGNACEIRSQDISVSRMHASVSWDEQSDSWQIEDLNSKFGTLLILKDDVEVEGTMKEIQIGRIVLKMRLVNKNQPSIQQKLTQLPQIKQCDDDEDFLAM